MEGCDGAVEVADAGARRAGFEAWRLFLGAHAVLVRGLDARLREAAGIPLTWYDVLVHVAESPGRRIRLRDLERRVLISQSAVSRLAARMHECGLLARSTPAEDRRSVEVSLTDEGARRLRAARAVAREEILRSFVGALDGDEAERLAGILRRFSASPPS